MILPAPDAGFDQVAGNALGKDSLDAVLDVVQPFPANHGVSIARPHLTFAAVFLLHLLDKGQPQIRVAQSTHSRRNNSRRGPVATKL